MNSKFQKDTMPQAKEAPEVREEKGEVTPAPGIIKRIVHAIFEKESYSMEEMEKRALSRPRPQVKVASSGRARTG